MLNISTDAGGPSVDLLLAVLGLSAIAVGLGAMMPDLREQSPSKIAAGFGGTLNLVLSALYIMCWCCSPPCPAILSWPTTRDCSAIWGDRCCKLVGSNTGMRRRHVATLVIGVVATVLPLRVGLRAFRAMEF